MNDFVSPEDAERKFREWASLFPDKLIMSVAVFADDTGTHDDTGSEPGSAVAGVCGFLSWDDDWSKFSGEWQEVLNRYNVPKFHFRVFADQKRGPNQPDWPYHGWSEEKRRDFLLSLATIIGQRTQFGLSAFFNKRDYDELFPDWWKEMGTTPYMFCIMLFFDAMADELQKRWPLAKESKVSYIFDRNPDLRWTGWVNFFFFLKIHIGEGERMGTLSFAESKATPPLQAADMLAYRMRQVNEKLILGTPSVKKSELDHAMFPNRANGIHTHHDREQLRIVAAHMERIRPQVEAAGKITKARLKVMSELKGHERV